MYLVLRIMYLKPSYLMCELGVFVLRSLFFWSLYFLSVYLVFVYLGSCVLGYMNMWLLHPCVWVVVAVVVYSGFSVHGVSLLEWKFL